jgi:RND family efflux transporter MFP subunit
VKLGIAMVVLALVAFAPGCRKKSQAPAPAPPAVTVARPVQRELIDWDTYTGRIEAPESVEVRARVSGQIVDAPFTEGALVQKGALLFVIDPRPYQAALDSAVADVARAQAQVAQADVQFQRTKQAASAVAQQELTNAQAALQQANAQLQAAQAAESTARLNLEWTRVTAPIAGRVGRKNITVGNLITAGASTAVPLTTIVSINPVYCYVDASERAVLKYQELERQGKRVSARLGRVEAFIQLTNEQGFPHEGYIDFVDNRIDPGTGTLRARGVFPNPTGRLTPGFYATMRVPGSGKYLATLVPDAAIVTQQNLRLLMTVNGENVVQSRPVKLGTLFGSLRAVEGVGPDDVIVINGLLRARSGTKVTPQMETFSLEPLKDTAMPPATQAATKPTGNPVTQPATTQGVVR